MLEPPVAGRRGHESVRYAGLWPIQLDAAFPTKEATHRAVATAAAILQRLSITMAAVISNHQIDRPESLRGVDETVPD
jgi:hypothetical protein